MTTVKGKFLAVLEVFVVRFVLLSPLVLGVYKLFPGFEAWQTEQAGFAFPVFVDVAMVGLALAAMWIGRRNLVEYGLDFKNLRYHLDIAGACFLPVVLANMPFGMNIDFKSWGGASILAAVQLGLLLVLALILRKKPSAPALGMAAAGAVLWLPEVSVSGAPVGKAAALFLTYALFVGFGEEITFRGYIQARLNDAFGKPFRFAGVAFGWGLVIASLLFGFSHVGFVNWLLDASAPVTLAWGFWTFFGGLVFGFVREKSGSILAPALLHGLPQAIAMVVMLLM